MKGQLPPSEVQMASLRYQSEDSRVLNDVVRLRGLIGRERGAVGMVIDTHAEG